MWSDLRAQLRAGRIEAAREQKKRPEKDGHHFGRPPDLKLLPRIDDA